MKTIAVSRTQGHASFTSNALFHIHHQSLLMTYLAYSCFDKRLSQAYATMPIGIMGRKSLALID